MKWLGPAAVAAGLLVAGCGVSFHSGTSTGVTDVVNTVGSTSSQATVDFTKVEQAILKYTKQRGLGAQGVDCPVNLPEEGGFHFTCTAVWKSGETASFPGVETDGHGNLHVHQGEMLAPEVEYDIARYLERPPFSSVATCRQHVPIHVGHTFLCTTRNRTTVATIRVRITNPGGGSWQETVVSVHHV